MSTGGAGLHSDLPNPPPAAVIPPKLDATPTPPGTEIGPNAPPPPTTIGKLVAVTVILFAGVQKPCNGLEVYGEEDYQLL